jgi:hypothetical protein
MVSSPIPAIIMQARRKVTGHLANVGASSAGAAVFAFTR